MPRATWLSNICHNRLALIPVLAVLALVATSAYPASAQTPSAVSSNQGPIAAFTDSTVVIHNFFGFWTSFNARGSVAPAGTSITQLPGVSETATLWSPPAPRHSRGTVPVATTSS
jgi:hypothetical protein